MTESEADAVLDDYIKRHPMARAALTGDPLFQAHIEWLKQALDVLEPALRREGLDRLACTRVLNTVVYGVPDPEAAMLRMADQRAQLDELKLGPPTALHYAAGFLMTNMGPDEPSPVGATLRSTAPEPPVGTRVRDDCGTIWVNDGHRPACWVQPDAETHDPETWTKIAGNYGPVTVLEWGIEL